MPKFRKIIDEVDAYQLPREFNETTKKQVEEIATWCDGYITPEGVELKAYAGTTLAIPGDYIVKNKGGGFYPCKADVFEAFYSPVEVD